MKQVIFVNHFIRLFQGLIHPVNVSGKNRVNTYYGFITQSCFSKGTQKVII